MAVATATIPKVKNPNLTAAMAGKFEDRIPHRDRVTLPSEALAWTKYYRYTVEDAAVLYPLFTPKAALATLRDCSNPHGLREVLKAVIARNPDTVSAFNETNRDYIPRPSCLPPIRRILNRIGFRSGYVTFSCPVLAVVGKDRKVTTVDTLVFWHRDRRRIEWVYYKNTRTLETVNSPKKPLEFHIYPEDVPAFMAFLPAPLPRKVHRLNMGIHHWKSLAGEISRRGYVEIDTNLPRDRMGVCKVGDSLDTMDLCYVTCTNDGKTWITTFDRAFTSPNARFEALSHELSRHNRWESEIVPPYNIHDPRDRRAMNAMEAPLDPRAVLRVSRTAYHNVLARIAAA